ncbi:hypothetical protein GCM10010317_043030 [Streptomyces mirabilis]|nr:hypothetical protein GCM10010317_043030 [Streptomyces mirabilis]
MTDGTDGLATPLAGVAVPSSPALWPQAVTAKPTMSTPNPAVRRVVARIVPPECMVYPFDERLGAAVAGSGRKILCISTRDPPRTTAPTWSAHATAAA